MNASAAAAQHATDHEITDIRIVFRMFGLCCVVEDLGMAIRLNETSKENVRLMLKPWIVEAAPLSGWPRDS